jgi:hypothetical protein
MVVSNQVQMPQNGTHGVRKGLKKGMKESFNRLVRSRQLGVPQTNFAVRSWILL